MLAAASVAHAGVMAIIHASAFNPGEAWGETALAGLLTTPGVFGFVDGAGGMVLARRVADEAEILTIAVAPAARRRGLGRALVQAVLEQAADHGAARVFLEVATGNRAAVNLYTSLGFAAAGRRAGYYPDGEDAVLMRLDVCGR